MANIDLTTCACKAIAAATVGEIPFNGSSTVVTENYFNQFIHTLDE